MFMFGLSLLVALLAFGLFALLYLLLEVNVIVAVLVPLLFAIITVTVITLLKVKRDNNQ